VLIGRLPESDLLPTRQCHLPRYTPSPPRGE
jgi:hypothetical protein